MVNYSLFADGTIYLGWYISVLSTEFKRLTNQGLSSNQTLTYLYYCYRAVDRLDEGANKWTAFCDPINPSPFCFCEKDGFLMRNDWFGGKVVSISPLKYPTTNITAGVPETDFTTYGTGWSSTGHSTVCNLLLDPRELGDYRANQMSQDQIAHLYMGFMFTVKYLPNVPILVEVSPGVYQSVNFVQWARDITYRIASYLLDHNYWIALPHPSSFFPGVVKIGNYLQPTCRYWAAAADNILGINYYTPATAARFPLFFAASGAVMQSGYDASDNNRQWMNPLILVANRNVLGRSADRMLVEEGYYNHTELYGILHDMLYGVQSVTMPDVGFLWEMYLAPCLGPAFQAATDVPGVTYSANDPWMSESRWMKPQHRRYGGVNIKGEYNGLDYLLLYNAVYLRYGASVLSPNEYNTLNNDFAWNLPRGSWGTGSQEANVWGINYIKTTSQLASSAVATFRSQRDIQFLPGFNSVVGADYVAYIDTFTCEGYGSFKTGPSGSPGYEIATLYDEAPEDDYAEYTIADVYELFSGLGFTSTETDSLMLGTADSRLTDRFYTQYQVTQPQQEILIAFPQPCSGSVTVQRTLETEWAGTLTLHSIQGNAVHGFEVEWEAGSSSISLELAGIPAGVYILTYTGASTVHIKIVVQ